MDTGISLDYIRRQFASVSQGDSADMKQYAQVKYTSEQEQAVLQDRFGDNILLRFLYKHKDSIKNIPFLGNLFIHAKNKAVRNTVEKRKEQPISIEGIINLEDEEYIRQIYVLFLNREPDKKGFDNMMNVCMNSGDRESLAYIIYRSKEFGRRAKFAECGQCRRKYLKYRIRLIAGKHRNKGI